MSAGQGFYSELPEFSDFQEVCAPEHYRAAPDDWLVVITDVIGSTKAIEAGRYKDVNAIGVASIVALRNAIPEVDMPFVFGGDGATLLAPSSHRSAIEAALRGVRAMAHDGFDIGVRAAIVPVAELRADGHEVRVSRFRASEHAVFAMFSGSGLTEAERRAKDLELGPRHAVSEDGPSHADFDGFECRWQPIPSHRGQVASILVQATRADQERARETYRDVLGAIGQLVEGDGRPVGSNRLNLQPGGGDFASEARIRSRKAEGVEFLWRMFAARFSTFVGRTLLSRGWSALGFPGAVYRGQVVANTDFRKFDDTLRMVLDVDAASLAAITEFLTQEHADGKLVFGVHVSDASLMTCAIGAYHGDHVHFVDGANGGYALAAKQLKRQLGGRQQAVAGDESAADES